MFAVWLITMSSVIAIAIVANNQFTQALLTTTAFCFLFFSDRSPMKSLLSPVVGGTAMVISLGLVMCNAWMALVGVVIAWKCWK